MLNIFLPKTFRDNIFKLVSILFLKKQKTVTMKNLLPFILILFFSNCKTAQKIAFSDAILQSEKFASELQKTEKIPGMAIAVAHHGKIVWEKGLGYADLDKKIPVDPTQTKFRIGSVSKPYTTAALAQLYEQGKVDLDAPIQTYVPYFPKKKYDISLRQLGGHLAGIRHYNGMEFLSQVNYKSVKDGIDIFKESNLMHEPGSKYSYSSYGWNLISAAIEGASKEEFLVFMQKNVFDKLDMKNTTADHVDQNIPNRTQFYQKSDKVEIAPRVDNSYKWAGGGFLSTAEDMVKFGNAHLNNDFLKKETMDVFLTNQATNDGKLVNYGIGWAIGLDKKNRSWFGHSGGSVGGTTFLIIYPEQQIVVAITTNMSRVNFKNLPFRIANQFLTSLENKN